MLNKIWRSVLAAMMGIGILCSATMAWAEDLEAIKKAISQKWTQNMPALPPVQEVRATGISGLYEVRLGESEIVYSDAKGDYILQGNLLDLQNRRDLTQERIDQLTAVDFKALPFKDAIVIKRGDGSRQLAVFEDPNCGYCHKFEQQLATVDNVTVYVFLYPILSPDSHAKSRNIWCAANPAQAWQDWMLRQKAPSNAACDTAPLVRNVAFGEKYRITGTPTLIFADGSRIPGAVDPATIEQRLAVAHAQ